MITVRGLIGAFSGLLILLVLILFLSETRQWLGQSDWGIYWLSRFANVQFISIWFCLLVYSLAAVPCGYILGNRLLTMRQFRFAIIGALLRVSSGFKRCLITGSC